MRIAVYCGIAAGIALAGVSAVAATSEHPALPTVQVPAVALSAGSSQDMDQAFLNLLQLLGPEGDSLVSGVVEFPELVSIDGAGLEGFDALDVARLPPIMGENLGDFTIPTSQWRDAFEHNG